MITAPDGWPLWTSQALPGREHDTTCARPPKLLPALDTWTDLDHTVLADLGYEGENQRLTCPIKATGGQTLTAEQRTVNMLHSAPAPWPNAKPDLRHTAAHGGRRRSAGCRAANLGSGVGRHEPARMAPDPTPRLQRGQQPLINSRPGV